MEKIWMPCIVREHNSGQVRYALQDELFRNREVECVGEITRDSAHALILQLRFLKQEDGEAPVTMYINSPGGDVYSGLALYDMMQALSCPVKTVCTGRADSMAALLLMGGEKGERLMLPHSHVLIHDPLIPGGIGGSALKVDMAARELMKTREMTATVIAERTGHSLEEVYERTAAETFFDADEAVSWGIADGIIREL